MTIQAKALVRLTGIILSLSLLTTIAAKAQAGAGDSGSTESFNINDKSVVIEKGGDYTITGTGVETEYTITVNLPSPTDVANITINNVKIGLKGCPFNIKQGVVKLTLDGDNVLNAQGTGSDNIETWCAALQVSEDSELVITKESIGKLTATGGRNGAGIGGGRDSDAGSITISGGNVVATGGYFGAGIGGGGYSNAGSITISGGTVTARGGSDGASIGGSCNGSVDVITISGGIVTTDGNIGNGSQKVGSVTGTISGGTIDCKSISSSLSITGGSVRTKDNSVVDGKGMTVVKVPNANAKVTSINIGGDSSYGSKDVYTDGEGKLYLYMLQDKSDPVTLTIEGIDNPLPASREYDITNGPITITAAGDYAIVGGGTQTGNAITVNLGKKEDVANITIEGVKIGLIGCPFDIKQGVVNLTLEGDNVLKALGTVSDNKETWCAALQVSEDSELVITKESTGKLTATGGNFGAGIGGGMDCSTAGYIAIEGGTVVATGGTGGAGIGGGVYSKAGSITIEGGTVVATGGGKGAGIGGGFNSNAGSITIESGTVAATGGEMAAGIGGGSNNHDVSITISGGKVTTTGNIGDGVDGSGATGTISGGTIVCKSISPNLSITGGSVRTKDNSFVGGKVMAVVKGFPKGEITSITIDEVKYGSKDVYTDENGKLYLYIQQGKPASVTLEIGNQKYTLPAIREYDITNGSVTITAAGTYTITGSEQTENAITVNINNGGIANITIEGVDIKTGDKVCPFNIIQGTVNLTLAGNDNKLQAGMPCAALQVSTDSKLLITKESKGKLTATGGTSGAGIGGGVVGGAGSHVGSITIEGGTVKATGGSGATGIGGGDAGTISSITIAGGTVEATGGSGVASIGGSNNESKGFITISGGTVMAYTEIGYSGTGSTVTGTITGGTIVCGSITSSFTISGGSVHSLVNNVMDDGKGMAVIKGLPKNAKVKSITIDNDKSYGMNDVYTDGNGLLYLYIPKDKPVPLSLTMDDQEEYSASYVATSDKYSPFNPGANASLVQKTTGREPVLFRNQNGGIIEMDDEWNDTPTVGSLVKLKIKSNSVLNYNKLEGISEEDLNVKFTGKVDDTDKGEAEYILTYTISFNMPNHDVCISLFDKLLVEGSKEGYEVALNKLTIKKPGEYTLKGAYAFLSDEEKKEINPSEIGVVFSVAVKDGIGDVTLHLDGVSLMSNALSVPALSCGKGSGNTVKVVPDGDNYLEGGYEAAGINKGPDAGTLTIEGPGRLEVKGGSNAAGIGGNYKEQANNITIAGGTIVAGGNEYIAGIGSGAGVGTATNISITGGSVNATVEVITNKQTAVTFPAMPGAKVINANVEDLGGYGLPGMNLYPKDSPSTATLYLWLPSGDTDKEITINGYSGKVTAGNSATLEVITIDTNKPYDPDTHKDKSITIAPDVTFTINAPEASVIDLTIEPGGKLLIDQKLEVQGTFAVQRNVTNKWTTFCSPVDLTLLNGKWANDPLEDDCLYLKSGYTSANDQKWTLQQSIKAYTSYLLASDAQSASSPTTFYTQRVTLQGKEKIDTMNPSDFDNNLLFRANTSLTEQTLKDIYVLDVSSQKLVLKTEDYILKPFEAYFVASPATRNMLKTISLLGSDGQPTGIAEVKVQKNTNFKAYSNSPGTLTFENQGEPAAVIVVNALGKGMFVYSNFTGSKHLYGLSAGVYFVRSNKEVKTVIVY